VSKPIHFGEQLIQCLLTFVVAETDGAPRRARFADGVQLVDEHDAGRFLPRLFEQIANSRGTHAHEHFHKLRAGDGEERDARFARDRFCEQRLARAGRPDKKHAFGNAASQLLVLLRLFQEVDHFLKLQFGFIDAGHVFKGYFPRLGLIVNLRFVPAEREGIAASLA